MRLLRLIPLAIISAAVAIGLSTGCRPLSPQQARAEAYADSIANNVAKLQLRRQKFVLTADRLTINNSPIINVTDNTNFVVVDSLKGIVQISPRNFGGPNNMGGITVTGDISHYDIKEDKNGDVTVTYRLTAPVGTTDVRILLHRKSNRAEATVSATFNRGRSTLIGEIKSLGANYFEGRSF